ncbi:MAG TPA: HD domain-containing protein, partial [bacterium]
MDLDHTIIGLAREFAREKHFGQRRKYTEAPYFDHCESVAGLVAIVTGDKEVVAAAYLHDVMEDCDVDYTTLLQNFGKRVADLV